MRGAPDEGLALTPLSGPSPLDRARVSPDSLDDPAFRLKADELLPFLTPKIVEWSHRDKPERLFSLAMNFRFSGPHNTLPVRPLHQAERELLGCFAQSVDLDRVRIFTQHSRLGRVVARVTGGAAVALGYRIILPGNNSLPVLAHELTHVSQYQRWGRWRYYLSGAWNQVVLRLLLRRDVYRWRTEAGKTFDQYGMEQQGRIVEDCFNVASPRRAEARHLSPFLPK